MTTLPTFAHPRENGNPESSASPFFSWARDSRLRGNERSGLSRRCLLLSGVAFVCFSRDALAAPALMTVHKDPNCNCCTGWVAHLNANGFATKVVNTSTIEKVKARLRVPGDLGACHTGEIAGYVIEGHVPAAAIKRLLAERPMAIGLAVPGMPAGSPGMGGTPEEYDVILFGKTGNRVYARFKGDAEI